MFKTLEAFAAATLIAVTSHAAAATAAPAEKPLSVVLVHGAFVDGSGWQKVYNLQ